MRQRGGPDTPGTEAQPGEYHAERDSEDNHHTYAEQGMAGIVIPVQDDERRVPQSPYYSRDDGGGNASQRRESQQPIAAPAELLAEGENHVERDANGETQSSLYPHCDHPHRLQPYTL